MRLQFRIPDAAIGQAIEPPRILQAWRLVRRVIKEARLLVINKVSRAANWEPASASSRSFVALAPYW